MRTPTIKDLIEAWADRYCTEFADLDHDDGCPARQKARDWLAGELRHAKARALEEAAEAWDNGTVDHFEIKHSSDAPLGWSDKSVADAVMSSGPVMDWLRNRANNLKDNQ